MVEGYTPEQVEEVRMVVRLLPVFFTTILYWTVYAQMGTFFIMQARSLLCCVCSAGPCNDVVVEALFQLETWHHAASAMRG